MSYARVHPFGGPREYVADAEADLATITNPLAGEMALAQSEGTLWYHTGTAWTQLLIPSAGSGGRFFFFS